MLVIDEYVKILCLVLINAQASRTKPNAFNPVLSANAYVGHVREDGDVVQVEPRLDATDADPSNTLNGWR